MSSLPFNTSSRRLFRPGIWRYECAPEVAFSSLRLHAAIKPAKGTNTRLVKESTAWVSRVWDVAGWPGISSVSAVIRAWHLSYPTLTDIRDQSMFLSRRLCSYPKQAKMTDSQVYIESDTSTSGHAADTHSTDSQLTLSLTEFNDTTKKCQRVLHVSPEGLADRASQYERLGIALHSRYQRTGSSDGLGAAP
jgi:hypothetical protein